MLIVEHPTVTEMQSSKKRAVASLDFVSKCNVGYSLMIIYIHIFWLLIGVIVIMIY